MAGHLHEEREGGALFVHSVLLNRDVRVRGGPRVHVLRKRVPVRGVPVDRDRRGLPRGTRDEGARDRERKEQRGGDDGIAEEEGALRDAELRDHAGIHEAEAVHEPVHAPAPVHEAVAIDQTPPEPRLGGRGQSLPGRGHFHRMRRRLSLHDGQVHRILGRDLGRERGLDLNPFFLSGLRSGRKGRRPLDDLLEFRFGGQRGAGGRELFGERRLREEFFGELPQGRHGLELLPARGADARIRQHGLSTGGTLFLGEGREGFQGIERGHRLRVLDVRRLNDVNRGLRLLD